MWLYMGVVMVVMVIGGVQVVGLMCFLLLDCYLLVIEVVVEQGMFSVYYELLCIEYDCLLCYLMILADVIQGSWLWLFILYQLKCENVLVQCLCVLFDGGNMVVGLEVVSCVVVCLVKVWQVSLDGMLVLFDGFLFIEWCDLEMCGLVGYLLLEGLLLGCYDLLLVWNVDGGKCGCECCCEYCILFWYVFDDKC